LACRGGDWLRQKATQTFFLTPDLPFGFEIGKIVKYAGLNSDQLDLILARLLGRAGVSLVPRRQAQVERPRHASIFQYRG